MLDILEWALDVIGVTYLRLDGRYSCHTFITIMHASKYGSGCFYISLAGMLWYILSEDPRMAFKLHPLWRKVIAGNHYRKSNPYTGTILP